MSTYAADTIIVNDTWADGNRTSVGVDGTGYDTPWYAASTSTLSTAMPPLVGACTTSATWWTIFSGANSGNPLVTLQNAGDEIKATLVFTPYGVAANNSSLGFDIALAKSPTPKTTDGSQTGQQYSGYSVLMNMGTTLGSTFNLKEWTLAGTGSLLGNASNWGANGTSGLNLATTGTSGNQGFKQGESYTFVMDLVLDGSGYLDITASMTGGVSNGGLNGVGYESVSYTDTSPNGLSYDTFEVRPTASSQAAGTFDIQQFEVEQITLVPEPVTLALSGLGMLGLVLARRMRR